jgi:hypothetical protein
MREMTISPVMGLFKPKMLYSRLYMDDVCRPIAQIDADNLVLIRAIRGKEIKPLQPAANHKSKIRLS